MGQLTWEAAKRRCHTTAKAYYEQSADLACYRRETTLEAHALLRTCYVALYGAHDAQAGLAILHVAEGTRHAAVGRGL
ncbi:hypothetical protein ACIQVF_37535 [Streptomyces tendae]|uniref:hypothetical protein n=1 Tax=Streptomyces tendae TaxID=1932 RepID=UPI00381904BB